MVNARSFLLVLYGLAAAISLAYEILWIKRMALVCGMSAGAHAVVLAVFISGVAGGAAWVGWQYRPDWNICRRFAIIEILVGIWALITPFLFEVLDGIYTTWAPADNTAAHQVLRLLLCAAVLFAPAVGMGAVLPLLSRTGVSRVYALGMSGSVIGALLAGLILLPAFGWTMAIQVLGALNIAIGLAALRLRLPGDGEDAGRPARDFGAECSGALLGAGLFSAQGVWFSLVWLIVDRTVYSSGLVIATVLLAMSLGAVAAARFPKLPLRVVLVATAYGQLLTIPLVPFFAGQWTAANQASSFAGNLVGEGALALAIVGLPSLGYGAALSLLCTQLAPKAVGRYWTFHHLGCLLGALGAPFLLVPLLGITATLALSAGLIAAVLLMQKGLRSAVAVCAACALAPLLGDVTFRGTASGTSQDVVFHYEAADGMVEVFENKQDGTRTLVTSRLRQEGSDRPAEALVERLQGRLPLVLQPNHDDVLVVGLGTGITLSSMLGPDVKRLTCVEISEGVIRGARFFEKANRSVLDDPRVRLVRQDGRNFVKLNEGQYDLVVQELFFPYGQGVGSLYTRDHYLRCKDRLKPGGFTAQWISLAQIGAEDLRTLVATFDSVFEHSSAWLVGGYLMLWGGELEPAPVPDEELLRHFLATNVALRKWSSEAEWNTEDNFLIEYCAPRSSGRLNTTALAVENLTALAFVQEDLSVLGGAYPDRFSKATRHLFLGIAERQKGNEDSAVAAYRKAFQHDPGNEQVRAFLVESFEKRGDFESLLEIDPSHALARFNRGIRLYRERSYAQAAEIFQSLLSEGKQSPKTAFNLANCWARLGKYEEAEELYAKVLELDPSHEDARHNIQALRQRKQKVSQWKPKATGKEQAHVRSH